MKSSTTSIEKRELRRIPEWIWPRICSHANVQSDDGTDPSQLLDACGRNLGALDPSDLGSGHPDRLPHPGERQSSRGSTDANVATDTDEVRPREARPTIGRTISSCHGRMMLNAAYLAVTCS